MNNIDRLPKHVLIYTLGYIADQNLAAIARTSRAFRAAIEAGYPQFLEVIKQSYGTDLCLLSFAPFSPHSIGTPKRLSLN